MESAGTSKAFVRFILIAFLALFMTLTNPMTPAMADETADHNEQAGMLDPDLSLQFQYSFSSLLEKTEAPTSGSVEDEDDSDAPMSAEEEQAMIAEALNNPLSYLWLMFVQYDLSRWDGDILDDLDKDPMWQNTTLIQPVMSFQLTEEWKAIIRPVFPINSFKSVDNIDISVDNPGGATIGVDFDRETGLGDIVLWNAFSNSYKPPFIWGFGPTVMMDTATDDSLGTGKWSAGPMALGMYIGEKWILGGIAQHWWSFAGDDNRTINTSLGRVEVENSDVNLTDFQYIIRYRYSDLTNIGAAPNIRYNWETDQLNLPIGIGADTLVKLGKLPVKIGTEVYYYVERDEDLAPEWQVRIFFVPVLPSPKWSRSPLF